MYLTKFSLNPSRRGTRHLLGSPQRMHAAVLACYPPEAQTGRVLWRVDRPQRHECFLYVVGAAEPDLTTLVEQAGWPMTQTWQTTTYAPFLSRLADGQRWRFRLSANPVHVLRQEGAPRGKVVPHVTAHQQEQWLREHGAGWGFSICDPEGAAEGGVVVTGRQADAFSRGDPAGGRRGRVTISRVQFDGALTVTDVGLFREALVGGMGRAKAYGCGLMTLARPR
ncbi:CRISPR system Cascade subunit CasE [Austwickia chelonae]|uniref:Putative CRISPR-associated protein n=1 Tax=Austwickia chelonae NBRC 105200 TaxID=1184607 RepID=K6UP10_9MICO|nr:type I-E CRISPR-associated protein Cas6/Cse3/CasE [Austwickia chelonae]GAB79421.1 putative CRISPR-associated protein [Austwickia chelonae NBRC 105200]SEW36941.1 CRISPR system Cascade subunit CasE [Austwickia chelonae]